MMVSVMPVRMCSTSLSVYFEVVMGIIERKTNKTDHKWDGNKDPNDSIDHEKHTASP
jgi:hypothetical protein